MNLKFNALRNENRFRSVSYTLVFLMMACIVLTVSILTHNLLPNWHAMIMGGILLFVVIDHLYTYRHLKSLTVLSSEWALALGAQWIVIALFSRFLLSYANGPDAFIADLSLIVRGYIANFFTPEFVITILVAVALWSLTAQFLGLLDEMGLDMKLALGEEHPLMPADGVPAQQRMVSLIFMTGVVLVILTAMTRLNLRNIAANTVGMPTVELSRFSGGEAGALLYFIFGLALLSLSRLMSLQTHWNRLRIPVSSTNLPGQWARYSLFFLLTLALVVSLLPAGNSLGFFSILGTLFGFLFSVFFFLFKFILFLALLLFSLPFLLLGMPPPFAGRSAPPPMPTLPTQPVFPASSSAIWELIRSIFLWGSLLAILVYAVVRFARQHESVLAALRGSRVVSWLILAWQWLYRNVDKARESLGRVVLGGWQGIVARLDGKRILPRPGWISLRSLDPRRRVYFFYLAMIRRGAEQGVRREPSQSPAEYAATLEKAIPSASDDIDSITEAFTQARYSRHEISVNAADHVKATWQRIRRALQAKAKSEKLAGK